MENNVSSFDACIADQEDSDFICISHHGDTGATSMSQTFPSESAVASKTEVGVIVQAEITMESCSVPTIFIDDQSLCRQKERGS